MLAIIASRPGGLLAVGSRPNRFTPSSAPVLESNRDAPGGENSVCFGRFNRKDDAVPYRKPEKVISVLRELFHRRPKLDEFKMLETIRIMKDPADGGLMFCYAKRGTPTPTGMKEGSTAWNEWEGCLLCKKKPSKCNGKLL